MRVVQIRGELGNLCDAVCSRGEARGLAGEIRAVSGDNSMNGICGLLELVMMMACSHVDRNLRARSGRSERDGVRDSHGYSGMSPMDAIACGAGGGRSRF